MGIEEDTFVSLREFARTDAHIHLAVRLVPTEERPHIHSKISAQALLPELHALPDLEDKLLTDWLKLLNAKLDCLVTLLTREKEGFSSLPFLKVNISGGGLCFHTSQEYARGDILELKMLLPMMPPVALISYGEIVALETQPDGLAIGVKFVAIDEEIRDEIIRFVFKMQREQLREKRK